MMVESKVPASSSCSTPGRTTPASTASARIFSARATRGTKARDASAWWPVSSSCENSAMTGVGLFFEARPFGAGRHMR